MAKEYKKSKNGYGNHGKGRWDMKGSKQLKIKMLKALKRNLGIVTYSCQEVGISQQCHYRWLKKDEEYKEAVESLSDSVLDFAERQLHKNIQEGKEQSLIFLLKCKGKGRGYIDRQVVDHNINVPMNEAALEFFEMPSDEPKAIEAQEVETIEEEYSLMDFEEIEIEDDSPEVKEMKQSRKDLLNRFKKDVSADRLD